MDRPLQVLCCRPTGMSIFRGESSLSRIARAVALPSQIVRRAMSDEHAQIVVDPLEIVINPLGRDASRDRIFQEASR